MPHTKAPSAESSPELTAEQRVTEFFSAASPEACELAELLATVPLSLPVMRLVQQTMLPGTGQVHLAEVFLSGLLQSTTTDPEKVAPDEVQYNFLPGVREYLLAHVPVSKSLVHVGGNRYRVGDQ
jgi:hypothetical protein